MQFNIILMVNKILTLLEKIIGRKIVFIPQNGEKRMTATKSMFGFWYAGNIIDSSDISYGIFRNGLVEKNETDIVVRILKEISIGLEKVFFYDIGANSGYYGILAAYLGNGKTQTFSFEPLKEYTSFLEESVKLNRLEKEVRIFELALGSKEGKAVMEMAGSGSSLTDGFLGGKNKYPTREVVVTRLDTLVKKENLPTPHFVKIDVEAFELEVLKGSLETIKASQPIIFIEIINIYKGPYGKFINKEAVKVFDLLTSLDYNGFIVGENIEAVNSVVENEGAFMYLFLNKNSPLHENVKRNIL